MQAKLTNKPTQEVVAAIQALELESVKIRLMDPELGEVDHQRVDPAARRRRVRAGLPRLDRDRIAQRAGRQHGAAPRRQPVAHTTQLGQVAHQLQVLVVLDHPVEDQGDDLVGGGVGGEDGVEPGGVPQGGRDVGVAGSGLPGGGGRHGDGIAAAGDAKEKRKEQSDGAFPL